MAEFRLGKQLGQLFYNQKPSTTAAARLVASYISYRHRNLPGSSYDWPHMATIEQVRPLLVLPRMARI
jgi:hypothetical protein